MARLFGTDGVRGLANRVVTAELAVDLAAAAARVIALRGDYTGSRPVALLGRDPRASGEFISAAVTAGLASAGVDVWDVGVVPTPAVAHLTATLDVDLGVMISASHNAMEDNGIKFFDGNGHKLADAVEDEIAATMRQDWERPTGADVGRVSGEPYLVGSYIEHVTSTIDQSLQGLRVVVDCAHGAASAVGPAALRAAGAEVIEVAADPDGENINDGVGSTHPDVLRMAVRTHKADAGVAFDGDADRCIAVDNAGNLVDGDQILGILALAFQNAGRLTHDTLVATVMSNLGLLTTMRDAGIAVVTTNVGDRYVLEEMVNSGYNVGGEQSGHVLLTDYSTTGDGVLTALQLLDALVDSGKTLEELAGRIPRLPQVMVNVSGVDKSRVGTDAELHREVIHAEETLGRDGRVLLRPSGTEDLVRVMVEAREHSDARDWAERLAEVVRNRLGS